MSELTFIGTARAKPGHADDLEREMRSTVAATHAEPGCVHYSMHKSLEARMSSSSSNAGHRRPTSTSISKAST